MPPEESQSAPETSSPGALRPAPESLLGVDLGSVFTKVALFEPVEGQYRLVARARARTDSSTHVYESLARACQPIEALTGRQLFANGEPLAGDVGGGRGVEVLGVSLSCPEPLHVLATNPEAVAAARGEYCQIDLLTPGSLSDKISQLGSERWDAIVGRPNEVEQALQCLGRGEGQERDTGPATITGEGDTIRQELAGLVLQVARSRIPGLAELAASATEPFTSGTSAILELTRLIADRFGLRLGIVDCGATRTILCQAGADGSGVRVARHDRPLTDLPVNQQGLDDLHTALQITLADITDDGFAADLLVATGALGYLGRWSEPALTLLNGIRPVGVIQFALDSAGIISQLAAFAVSYPDIACHIFEQDGLLGLGAAICPRGAGKPGAKAIEVRWQANDEPEQAREVNYGELVRLPLSPGRKASLALYPTKHIDVGLNRPGVAAKAHVDGGRVGLIVDTREPAEKSQRASWRQALD